MNFNHPLPIGKMCPLFWHNAHLVIFNSIAKIESHAVVMFINGYVYFQASYFIAINTMISFLLKFPNNGRKS